MKKILLLTAAPLTMLASVVVPSTASAAVSSGNTTQCYSGGSRVCVFKDNDFSGSKGTYSTAQLSIGSLSDQVSSIANGRSYRAFFHKDTNYGGNWNICLSKNKKDNDLPNDRNDEISSVNFASTYQYC